MNEKLVFTEVAYLVRESRTKNTNLSQNDLAKKLHYKNGQLISNIERGLCSVPKKRIKALSKELKIPVTKLTEAMVADYQATLENHAKG